MVIVICEGLDAGGAVANVAWQQALGLSKHQPVCLISDGLSAIRRQKLKCSKVQLRLRLVKVPGFRGLRRFSHLPRQIAWIMLAIVASQRELQGIPATIICHSHPLAAAITWWFRKRMRVIMVSHGDIFHRPPGTYDPAITWLYRRTTATGHRRAAMSIALSPVMVDRIQAHGVPPERITLIPNGLDPAEIGLENTKTTTAEHWQQKPLRLLFVGRLDLVKGVEVLLEALALAMKAGVDLQLDLIGAGTPSSQHRLRELSKQLLLQPHVRWHGPQPRTSLARHYQRCHLVMVPSLDDPLPTVALEALACGRPVLGSDVGGIKFMVGNGESGVLVPPGQPVALAQAIIRLNDDRNGLATLAQSAQQRGSQLSWATNVSALQEVIGSFCVPEL